MFKIKRSPADDAFSQYIRARDGWVCQRCLRRFDPTNNRCAGIDCSHFKTRGNRRVRFDPDNAVALCRGCHIYFGKNPDEHTEFFKKRLGEKGYTGLVLRANTRLSQKIDERLEKIKWAAALIQLAHGIIGKDEAVK